VTLAAERVAPAKPLMSVQRAPFQDRSAVLLILTKKVLERNSFDDRMIHHCFRQALKSAVASGGGSSADFVHNADAFMTKCPPWRTGRNETHPRRATTRPSNDQ
jgi:hypothetical protein